MKNKNYYFDSNATTKIDDAVLDAMLPYLKDEFYNPSALYSGSQNIRGTLIEARENIADFFGVLPKEILFTSCATEANNTIIKSMPVKFPNGHIIVSNIEHPSIYNTAKFLEFSGYDVSYINADKNGSVDVEHLRSLIKDNTKLISVMYVNNETGVVQPIKEISKIAKENSIAFHVDAVQAIGKIDINMENFLCDYLTVSAHKFHGPKGIGVLYRRQNAPIIPLLHGGSQEFYMRSGTENVANIIGMAKAFSLLKNNSNKNVEIKKLRDYFEQEMVKEYKDQITINGSNANRVGNTSNFSIKGLNSDEIILSLDMKNIFVSSGSACSAGLSHESRILEAMSVGEQKNMCTLRISIDKFTKKEDVDYLLKNLKDIIKKLK